MIINIDVKKAKKIMKAANKDFSKEALSLILEYYNRIGENTEFDVKRICSKWKEATPKDFLRYYGDRLKPYELDFCDDDKIDILSDRIADIEFVHRLSNDNILITYCHNAKNIMNEKAKRTINIRLFEEIYQDEYNFIVYRADNGEFSHGYSGDVDDAITAFDDFLHFNRDFVCVYVKYREDLISSDKEAAAFMFALEYFDCISIPKYNNMSNKEKSKLKHSFSWSGYAS